MTVKRTLPELAEEARRSGVPEVDLTELLEARDRGDGPLVLDVREPEELVRGVIPGSVAVPRGVIERDFEKAAFPQGIAEGDLDRPIVCYCGGGSRSLLAADTLRKMGFTNASSMRGGFKAWIGTGQDIVMPT